MDELEISGKRYISSKRAGKENRYHVDYIGQLIRAGKIVGSKVGRTWYVEVASLDAYLGQENKTQSTSTKINVPIRYNAPEKVTHIDYETKQKEKVSTQTSRSSLTYIDEDGELLLPAISHTEPKMEFKKQESPAKEKVYGVQEIPKNRIKNESLYVYIAAIIGLMIFIGVTGISYYLHDDVVVDAASVHISVHF